MKKNQLSGWLPVLLLLFISCNQREEQPSVPEKPKDTNTVITPRETNPTPAQNYTPLDISPMDMIYFPVDYPKQRMAHTTDIPPAIRIIYSRPHRQGRKIFGEYLRYGEYWRLGANEATEIQLYRDLTIQDKKVPKGRYVLYCIPYENKWTMVFSSNTDSWGLSKDPADDLYRFDIPVTFNAGNMVEYFTMVFETSPGGCDLVMSWENMQAKLTFKI